MSLPAFQGFPAIAAHPFAYPALEVLHIVGIALLLGPLVLLEWRVWGAARELPMLALARLALPVSLAGFGLIAASGLVMFAADPVGMLAHDVFLTKLGLVALAAINAAVFHARDGLRRADRLARAQTVLSLGLWTGAIICGRWIAYL